MRLDKHAVLLRIYYFLAAFIDIAENVVYILTLTFYRPNWVIPIHTKIALWDIKHA